MTRAARQGKKPGFQGNNMFTESLTVRILGDSSDLQRELSSVVSQLEDFQSRLADAGDGSRELSEGLRDVGQAGRAAAAAEFATRRPFSGRSSSSADRRSHSECAAGPRGPGAVECFHPGGGWPNWRSSARVRAVPAAVEVAGRRGWRRGLPRAGSWRGRRESM